MCDKNKMRQLQAYLLVETEYGEQIFQVRSGRGLRKGDIVKKSPSGKRK